MVPFVPDFQDPLSLHVHPAKDTDPILQTTRADMLMRATRDSSAVMAGVDLGVASCMPSLGKTMHGRPYARPEPARLAGERDHRKTRRCHHV